MDFWCNVAMALAFSPLMPVFALTLRLGVIQGDPLWCAVGLFGFVLAAAVSVRSCARAWRLRNREGQS